jgi:hypothetical protein
MVCNVGPKYLEYNFSIRTENALNKPTKALNQTKTLNDKSQARKTGNKQCRIEWLSVFAKRLNRDCPILARVKYL